LTSTLKIKNDGHSKKKLRETGTGQKTDEQKKGVNSIGERHIGS